MTTLDNKIADRVFSRKKAYLFVARKIQKLKASDYYRFNKTGNAVNYISLSDLIGLKNGTSDPSPELVSNLKKLLQGSAIEAEIDRYLVQPFEELKPDQSDAKTHI